MEASTAQETQVVAEAERPNTDLFKWSDYVHVGEGAHECVNRMNGKCEDAGHFHAFIRLPTPFQHRDISEKAGAAKARRMKMYRDPESDVSAILDADLEPLYGDDAAIDVLVDELIDQDFQEDYDAALRLVQEILVEDDVEREEGEETPRLFANIMQDQEELQRRLELPEEQRGDDFEVIQKHVAEHAAAIDLELDKVQEPKRQALRAREVDDLVKMVRDKRVDMISTEVYLSTYNAWEWYVCTYKPVAKGVPDERSFGSLGQMQQNTPGVVIEALKQSFSTLELAMARDRMGNS